MTKSILRNFNEKALRVLLLAQEEARKEGQNRCGSEQILLGLLAQGDNNACSVLRGAGLTLHNGRALVRNLVGTKNDSSKLPWFAQWLQVFREMPLSKSAQDIIKFAGEDAHELKHAKVAPEHLLLGLLRLQTGRALQIFEESRVNRNDLKILLLKTQNSWEI